MFGPRDRDDVVALRENPGERKLRGRAFFLARNFFAAFHQVEIALEILALKSWRGAAVIVLRQIFEALDFPR